MPETQKLADPGGAAFLHVNALVHEVQQARAAVGLARRRVRQVLPEVVRLLRYVRHLPVLDVTVNESHDGRVLTAALTRRFGLVPATVAAAVLELPTRPEAYLVGRSMQAVRTGVNNARRQGLSVLKVTDDGERRARALELLGRVGADFEPPLREWAAGPHGESWFVVDAQSATRAIAVLNVDEPVARLDTVISARGDEQSPARYLLAAHVFMDLSARGVSHVLLEGALFLPPGLLEFQRRLGFRQMNIRLRPARTRLTGSSATTEAGTRPQLSDPCDAA